MSPNSASSQHLPEFDNTEVAFSHLSDSELRRAGWLFRWINRNWAVKMGIPLLKFALTLHLPVKWIIKRTIFAHFCGGETIEQCDKAIENLGKYKVGAILDYSVEGAEKEEIFDQTAAELARTIDYAGKNPNVPFTVFKITGLVRFALLEKLQNKEELTAEEELEWKRACGRVDTLCRKAAETPIPIMVDAEETWIQNPVDELCTTLMQHYNTTQAIVYNTYQMYRVDSLGRLQADIEAARKGGYKFGAKLVRGAYMEKERERAANMGYPSPIHPTKQDTDDAYDAAEKLCLDNIDAGDVLSGTHNELSCLKMARWMLEMGIAPGDKRAYFSQLLGMSDNLSFNLAAVGYNVVKYLPYGPVKAVMPYLFRRAEENTAISGQMGRELSLFIKEMKRREID